MPMVRITGLEPARLSAPVSKTGMATITSYPQYGGAGKNRTFIALSDCFTGS